MQTHFCGSCIIDSKLSLWPFFNLVVFVPKPFVSELFEGFHVWTMKYLRSDKTLCSALRNGLGVANFTAHVSEPHTFQSHAVI